MSDSNVRKPAGEEGNQLLTTAAAARIKGCDRGSLLWCYARGLIEPSARTEGGRPLWKRSDVDALKIYRRGHAPKGAVDPQ